MATFTATQSTSTGFSFEGLFTTNPLKSLATWNASRKTRIALSKLTMRELEDIGLTRGDIAGM